MITSLSFLEPMGKYIFPCVLGYICGSIPFGLILTSLFGLGDLRQIGSGNIGATNVLRAGSKLVAFITLLLDISKAVIAILIGNYLFNTGGTNSAHPFFVSPELLIGGSVFIGHIYPIWLKFKGGKGVASFFGCLIAIEGSGAIIFALVWALTFYLFRYSSLSALTASVLTAFWIHVFSSPEKGLFFLALTLLLWLRHRANILRLAVGAEGGFAKEPPA